jgi:hypothetical protein
MYPINAGPINSENNNGKKIIVVWGDNEVLVIVLKKSGWLQWYYKDGEIMNFDVYRFTEGMNDRAIEAKVAAGWIPHLGIGDGDARFPYVGVGPFIYKSHYIPNKPNNVQETEESLSESQQSEENNLDNNNSNDMIENNLSEEEESSVQEKNAVKPGKDNHNFDRGKSNNKGKALGKNK